MKNGQRSVSVTCTVGPTLILRKPEHIENASFGFKRDKLIIDYGNGSVVMLRVS